jgi:hypothetical protein
LKSARGSLVRPKTLYCVMCNSNPGAAFI